MATIKVQVEISYSEIALVMGRAIEYFKKEDMRYGDPLSWCRGINYVSSDAPEGAILNVHYKDEHFYEYPFRLRVAYYDCYGEEASITVNNQRLLDGINKLSLNHQCIFLSIVNGSRLIEDCDALFQCVVLGDIIF